MDWFSLDVFLVSVQQALIEQLLCVRHYVRSGEKKINVIGLSQVCIPGGERDRKEKRREEKDPD